MQPVFQIFSEKPTLFVSFLLSFQINKLQPPPSKKHKQKNYFPIPSPFLAFCVHAFHCIYGYLRIGQELGVWPCSDFLVLAFYLEAKVVDLMKLSEAKRHMDEIRDMIERPYDSSAAITENELGDELGRHESKEET